MPRIAVLSLVALVALAAAPARADCPLEGEGVVVEPARLRVEGAIGFDLYGPALDPASFAVIDAVARRLLRCPEIQIEIEVHTDTRRLEAFNARQSHAIARLVRERLIARGVSPARVVACGYGESRPIADGRPGWDPGNTRVEWIRVRDARAHSCPTAP